MYTTQGSIGTHTGTTPIEARDPKPQLEFGLSGCNHAAHQAGYAKEHNRGKQKARCDGYREEGMLLRRRLAERWKTGWVNGSMEGWIPGKIEGRREIFEEMRDKGQHPSRKRSKEEEKEERGDNKRPRASSR
ncbi:hypothetical protein BGX38DRAFT_1258101 [Terfezia claveryi]|nr:hypothetical protein BGX38DRAFT_1258101 [Terfezia claveryi]